MDIASVLIGATAYLVPEGIVVSHTTVNLVGKFVFRWIAKLSSGERLFNIVPLAEKEMKI